MVTTTSKLTAGAFAIQGISQIGASFSQSQATKASTEFQSQRFELNSKLAELHARDAIIRGAERAKAVKTKAKRIIGSQRVNIAAQGIEVNKGSALDIQLETAEFSALDALTIKNNAFREAAGFRIESIDLKLQGDLTKIAGKAKARNTILSGGLSALTSFSRGAAELSN